MRYRAPWAGDGQVMARLPWHRRRVHVHAVAPRQPIVQVTVRPIIDVIDLPARTTSGAESEHRKQTM
jgi:hypothetical protein